MTTYEALLRKAKGSDYGVEFPDFPGCVTAGRTADEAVRMAEEALGFHIQGMREDGEEIPEPTPLEEIEGKRAYRGAAAFLVRVRENTRKRINITLPVWLIHQIDVRASEAGTDRSAFLEGAVKEKLKASA